MNIKEGVMLIHKRSKKKWKVLSLNSEGVWARTLSDIPTTKFIFKGVMSRYKICSNE